MSVSMPHSVRINVPISSLLPSMLVVPRGLHLPPGSSRYKCTVIQFGTMTKSDSIEIDVTQGSKKVCVYELALSRRTNRQS